MNLLSWLLVAELLLMFCAYVAWLAGKMAGRDQHNDALYQFTLVFWRTFRQKPLPLRAPVLDEEDGDGESFAGDDIGEGFGDFEPPAPEASRGRSDDAAPAMHVIRQATLNVRVLANSQRDQIVGFEGKTLKVQVIADADSGSANKSVIDLLTSTLGIRTHQLLLVRGHFQAQKIFQISGMSQEEMERKLEGFE